jgi:hypothetical protein
MRSHAVEFAFMVRGAALPNERNALREILVPPFDAASVSDTAVGPRCRYWIDGSSGIPSRRNLPSACLQRRSSPMAESLYTVRNLKMFNALNKSIKQGITDLQNKDFDSSTNYMNFALKTAKRLEGMAEDPFKEHFANMAKGIGDYLASKNEELLVSTKPSSVHSQLWAVHKKICDTYNIPYLEDVDDMEAAIQKLADDGKIS